MAEKGEEVARGTRGTGRREIWSRVGGVPGGHFERIYRLFGGRALLGHSQGWLVCHITNPRSAVSLLASHKEKRDGVFLRTLFVYRVDMTLDSCVRMHPE